jgi:NAD-dependent dihydropyrimidine dehydrogenase PreA subunit
MRKPFAITLDVGVEPGRPHRRLAHRAPGLRAQPAAVQQRIPRRREHPAVAVRRGRRSREVRGCLGASEAVVVYRRTRVKMPAHDIEVEEALEEGGLPGAGPRPERRSVRPAERARRYLLRQRGRGRPRPDDRAPGHLRRRRHGAVGATGSYEIDYDYCKGCGLCVAECPPGAIEMEPEPS